MNIACKIEKEDGQKVYCYKQGAFWVAYEQSAYLICIDKAYKPKKKWIKYLEKEVVTVGFPPIALEFWQKENQVTCIEEKEN